MNWNLEKVRGLWGGVCLGAGVFLMMALPVIPLLVSPAWGQTAPADIYFGLAVTENSLNHYGENLLFLDFQDQVDTDMISDRVVISPRIKPGRIRMDGRADDWNPTYLTTVHGRVMNNYPLDVGYDAVPNDIQVGSVWDGDFIYFIVRFEDANHDASVDGGRWLHDGKEWRRQPHSRPREASPATRAANAGQALKEGESEDRVFFMFPVVDRQRNFRPNGLGCAMYCHSNLKQSGSPKEKVPVGAGVAAMHTIVPGDRADLWRWMSTSTRPGHTLEDGHLTYGEGPGFNGRRDDRGRGPVSPNDAQALGIAGRKGPIFQNLLDRLGGLYGKAGHSTALLTSERAVPLAKGDAFAKGTSLPAFVDHPPTGGRADVTAVGRFDPKTFFWTVEFRRALNTGDADDHQFVSGPDMPPPENPIAIRGDSERGEDLYINKGCDTCHGETGEGKFIARRWIFPRIQRVSGALISKTVKFNQEMRGTVASLIRREIQKNTKLVMPDIDISPQEAEDIAAWLQTQHLPSGR